MSIKILLADPSNLVRQVLSDLLLESHDITVIGCACNGRDAVDLTLSRKPDLVVMDLNMPVLDALEAIEEIMAREPTPVLVLLPAGNAAEMERAFNTIKRGALDIMEKPALDGQGALDDFAHRLVEKVMLLSHITVVQHQRRKCRLRPADWIEVVGGPSPNILAIGASTGGPKAVMTLLKSLPAGFPGSIFVVQHIADGFAEGFASWLDRACAIPVRVAVDGAKYHPGQAVVAPGGYHMTVCDGMIRLTKDAPVNCCRPSIDVFFTSLAQERCDQVVSLLLSGMGKDGAQGLLRIKERGGMTMVQDESSCAVFGMPKAAISLRAVNQVLPLNSMPAAISKLFAAR